MSVAPNDSLLYLACNHSNECRCATQRRSRSLGGSRPARRVNVEPSPEDGSVVTNKKDKSISVFDTRREEFKRIPTSKRIPHGIAFSPDGRYAFVTCESVGTDPGAIDGRPVDSGRRGLHAAGSAADGRGRVAGFGFRALSGWGDWRLATGDWRLATA